MRMAGLALIGVDSYRAGMVEKIIVSALVSVYASARFFPGCLEDLLNQSIMPGLEIIVIDSASPQNEGEIAARYCARWPENIVYVRTAERETIYAAWNRAARLARGRYLTNANADDRHHPDALVTLARVLDNNPDVALVYANSAIAMDDGGAQEDETLGTADSLRWGTPRIVGRTDWPPYDPAILQTYCFMGPQPMWRAELHKRYGYFDKDFTSAGDYEFWLRLAAGGERFLLVPEVLGQYLMRPDSAERRDKPTAKAETLLAKSRYRGFGRSPRPSS